MSCSSSEDQLKNLLQISAILFPLVFCPCARKKTDGEFLQVFVGMVKRLKEARHELVEILLLISISMQGLREAELLQLTKVPQFRFRSFCDLILDELLIASLGFLDFQSISLKHALRDAYFAERNSWDDGYHRCCTCATNPCLQFCCDKFRCNCDETDFAEGALIGLWTFLVTEIMSQYIVRPEKFLIY